MHLHACLLKTVSTILILDTWKTTYYVNTNFTHTIPLVHTVIVQTITAIPSSVCITQTKCSQTRAIRVQRFYCVKNNNTNNIRHHKCDGTITVCINDKMPTYKLYLDDNKVRAIHIFTFTVTLGLRARFNFNVPSKKRNACYLLMSHAAQIPT